MTDNTLYMILHDGGTEEHDYPDIREEGKILFRVWRLTGEARLGQYTWDDLEVLDRDGGAAYCLEEGEGLEYFLGSIGWKGHGWHVMRGLKGAYHKDYFGEVDVEWDDPTFRRATLPEILCGHLDATWPNVTMRSVFSFLYEEAHLMFAGGLPR